VLNLKEDPMKTCIFFTLSCSILCSALLAQLPAGAAVSPETVVAKVDGKDVTAGEIQKALLNMPPQFMQLFRQNPKAAVQNLFVMRYLAEEGEQLKLGERTPLKEQLEMQRANALAGARLNYEHDNYQVPVNVVNEYYTRNQAKYQQAKIKVISIAFKPAVAGAGTAPNIGALDQVARAALDAAHSQNVRSEADAAQRAVEVAQKVRAGEDFAKLVAEYSDDEKSKAAGGDFGVVTLSSSYPEEIKTAVFALNPGQVTDPIRQASAFYVIRLEEKSTQPMNEVMEPIIQELRSAHTNEWFKDLTKRFDPTVENMEFFTQSSGAIPTPAGPPKPASK
jgi:peptidyl-prolyl cis-trans isomerase C